MKVLLATTSKYKRELFERLQVPFKMIASPFDEDSFDKSSIPVKDLSRTMSYMKGKSLGESFPEKVVISADQVCLHEQRILSKPKTKKNAIKSLTELQGRTHSLMTSYSIFYKTQCIEKTIIASMKMKTLTTKQIQNYIELDLPLDCAGSYKLETSGITLFESINVSDYTSIIGLPLISLSKELSKLGVNPFE